MMQLSEKQERDLSVRAKRAHERMHGQSTWIEAHCAPSLGKVRVCDHELGIVTYWHILPSVGRRKIRFAEQKGERK